jgi:hypothetical protein
MTLKTKTRRGNCMTHPNSFNREQLLACGHGELFGEGNARLPLPNMLMMDRIAHISSEGGAYGKGEIIAELDIDPSLWFSGNAWLSGPGCHVAAGWFLPWLAR